MNESRDQEEKDVQAATQPKLEPETQGRLEDLFRKHHRRVFRVAYRITGNPMDAEDALQTVFMRLLRREESPTLSDDPTAYLHRAAVNAALDIVRSRRSNRAEALEEVESTLADSSGLGQERQVESREIKEEVRKALARLNPKMAEVFALRYFEGYGNNEIARMLGTSRSTIGVMLHRARHSLRTEVRVLQGDAS